jgi:hypothetical protein
LCSNAILEFARELADWVNKSRSAAQDLACYASDGGKRNGSHMATRGIGRPKE